MGWVHFRGLFDSDPLGSWCGARVPAERLAASYGLALRSANWNDQNAMDLVDVMRGEGCQLVVVTGHSHGAWRAGQLVGRYGAGAIDLVGFLDFCPFLDVFAQVGPPLDFPAAAAFGFACWQRNSEPAGIKFLPRPQVIVEDATAWVDPKLGHIDFPGMSSIAGDARVWAAIEKQLAASIASRTF